ncbi:MAG: NUDIX domain-containing protein [Bacteroidota bacterium]|jgi:ADP-ribose pyrophosphatase YjhB (NUDIX family)
MKVFLLKIWRLFPYWMQQVASRMIRPLFQVFAAAVIFDDKNRIFLVKLTYQRFHPWGIPGGGLEYSETAEEAVVREVWEETGLMVEIERFLLNKMFPPDKFAMYYLCRITNGVFEPSDEVSEYGYFSLNNLPDVRPRDYELINEIYEKMGFIEHELA